MDGSFRIGNLFGIPILLHYTFLLVIPLLAWIIGTEIASALNLVSTIFKIPPSTTIILLGFMPYILGAVVAVGLFLGVLVHELAHSFVAKRRGIRIGSIILMLFGGVAMIEEGAPDPKFELPMAVAGPMASLAIGVLCCLLVPVIPSVIQDPGLAGVWIFVIGYLGLLNIFLCAFNLLPAFPMDGGRILRAVLAKRMPLYRATQIAADVGKGFAVIFGIIGLLCLEPFLILIALFVYIGANMESAAMKYRHFLQDVKVGEMMSSPVIAVPPTTPLTQVIAMMYASKHLGFPVVDRGTLVGMITLADVNRLPPLDREAMQVRDVMTRDPVALPPAAPVVEALRIMSARNIGRIPVVVDGAIVGIITRTDILKIAELRQI